MVTSSIKFPYIAINVCQKLNETNLSIDLSVYVDIYSMNSNNK